MTEQPVPSQPSDSSGAPMDYAQCMAEVETILGELEANAVDLDLLAVRVRRAADLLKFCNERLESVRTDVATVVDQMNTDVDQ